MFWVVSLFEDVRGSRAIKLQDHGSALQAQLVTSLVFERRLVFGLGGSWRHNIPYPQIHWYF